MKVIYTKDYYKEKIIILLFILTIVISQGIRTEMNEIIHSSVFNYHFIPIAIIMWLIAWRSNKIDKINFILILSIIGQIFLGFISYRYEASKLGRTILSLILPLLILLIDYKKININYLYPRILKVFNISMITNFIIQIIFYLYGHSRTGGLIGHPLTAGWYYCILIALNCIYCRFFQRKKDILILLDALIALVGCTLASSRMSLLGALTLILLYMFTCVKSKGIKYIIFPLTLLFILNTDIVNQYIWGKFRETAAWGDITNGRLLGIRQMQIERVYPNFWIGPGIGYSNYITGILFETINFENPVMMFAFDYGILTVCYLLIILFIKPIILFIKNKNFLIALNFIVIIIIPFTYNGLAESIGLFIVLIFLIHLLLIINHNLKFQHNNLSKDSFNKK